ncbi:MAG: type II CRISPR-associated endonuclease Cas1 [Anaerolineaceae bacterium]
MSWRTIVVTGITKLELKLGYLVVRGETTTRISLSEVDTILVESTTVSLTTGLILELSRRKIKLIFCDEKHNPFAELIDYYGSVDSSLRIREQIDWPDKIKTAVWTSIVRAKLSRQRDLLLEKEKTEAAGLLDSYLNDLLPGDPSNREGHAAKVYFNALFGQGFSREQESPTNAALNYGYSILLSTFNKEITSRGYLTQLGLFHSNQFNPFNLSSDLMEPFRPLVDRQVLALELVELTPDAKHVLVDILNQTVMIEEKQQRVSQAIAIYCSSIFRAILNQDVGQTSHYQWSDS